MKIIELLNKIANGEDVPIEIVYNGEHYYNTGTTYENGSNENVLFWYEVYNEEHLNDEVEIIEEDKKIKKLAVNLWCDEDKTCKREMNEKINEIIDYINKGDK